LKILTTNIEQKLIASLREGDDSAFAKIYDEYWYRLFLSAYRKTREKEIAKEIVQNLFMRLWEKRAQLQISNLEGYLFTALKNAIINHVNAEVSYQNKLDHYRSFSSIMANSTERVVDYNSLNGAIEEGLKNLPERSGDVFKLNKIYDWPVGKIAQHLQLSPKAVEYHLARSLKFMRSYLKEFTLFSLLILLLF
jgi:RNA polymerase sigma-70 factor (family 1)